MRPSLKQKLLKQRDLIAEVYSGADALLGLTNPVRLAHYGGPPITIRKSLSVILITDEGDLVCKIKLHETNNRADYDKIRERLDVFGICEWSSYGDGKENKFGSRHGEILTFTPGPWVDVLRNEVQSDCYEGPYYNKIYAERERKRATAAETEPISDEDRVFAEHLGMSI